MTIVATYSVFCDGRADGTRAPNCPDWTAEEPSIAQALAQAKREGWQRDPSTRDALDRCPRCRS